MVAFRNLVTVLLLFVATSASGAAEGPAWPGSPLAALLGVVIVVFVLIRWKSKP